jgi:predicted RNA-binding Zn-ribbon protein involved in translation (DUF1610 family)
MERLCTQCHAVLAEESQAEKQQADWCPACGGALIERASERELHPTAAAKPEVDHRGIVLPRRHALGGIITPQ